MRVYWAYGENLRASPGLKRGGSTKGGEECDIDGPVMKYGTVGDRLVAVIQRALEGLRWMLPWVWLCNGLVSVDG